MAGKNFNLDIVTPTKTVFSGEVQSFSAPGEAGGFQVLFDHAPFLSSITVGQVKVIDPAGAVQPICDKRRLRRGKREQGDPFGRDGRTLR